MDPLTIAFIILFFTGIIAGLLSGMLGIGGGILMVPVMFFLLNQSGYSDRAMDIAVATSVAVILPTVLSGTYRQWKRKNISWIPALILGTGGLVGSVAGSYISILLPAKTHAFVFGIFLILMAVWIILQRSPGMRRYHIPGSMPVFLVLGFFTGISSGLFGIGGGVILTPVLATIIGYGMHKAVGIVTTSMVLTSSGATAAYIMHGIQIPDLPLLHVGYINIPFWAILCVASIPAAQAGVLLSHKTPERILMYIFVLLLLFIAIRMMTG
ncbi:MAG: sulfite exporter TauE/SafE family protein [Methanospirillaceae archaeon]|nr:sulfite exporter TauE/SafE family protein [Methanospirillaceae archaeon]